MVLQGPVGGRWRCCCRLELAGTAEGELQSPANRSLPEAQRAARRLRDGDLKNAGNGEREADGGEQRRWRLGMAAPLAGNGGGGR